MVAYPGAVSDLALPETVGALATELGGVPGVVAVVLGGSRAAGTHRPDSDWDLGIYYRGSQRGVDPSDVRALGHEGYVSEVGEWGPVVNGGAWLTAGGAPVDVLYRDLDVIDAWAQLTATVDAVAVELGVKALTTR